MSPDELETAFSAVARVRPFRYFQIDFISGDRLTVTHPEAVGRRGNLFLYRGPDHSQRVFGAGSVCQFLVPPPSQPGPTRGCPVARVARTSKKRGPPAD